MSKLSELPPAVQRQVLPGLKAALAALTPEKRSVNAKKGWAKRMREGEEQAKKQGASNNQK